MAREIEVKIRVADQEVLRGELSKRAVRVGPYHKRDTYFLGAGGTIRLRHDGRYVVCRKTKAVVGGVEVNHEIEFTVDDDRAFAAFAASLGYEPWYTKEKIGEAWTLGAVLVELGVVTGLGTFAEFEILLKDDADADEIERARRTLGETLRDLGIPASTVEPRPYAQLLGHKVGP